MTFFIKVFLTYAAISMVTGLILIILVMGDIVYYKTIPLSVIIILWAGPLMLGLILSLPYGIYKIWTTEDTHEPT